MSLVMLRRVSEIMFGGKVRSCLLVEGWGAKEPPHSHSLQAKPPFTKDGAKFVARKVGVTSTLRYIIMHRALQVRPAV